MIKLQDYIIEKLHIGNYKKDKYHPKDKYKLKLLIDDLIKERGENCDLNDIDVSDITDMAFLFEYSKFNGNISKWNVDNVTSMACMFKESNFDGDISKWNVSNVKYMDHMFSESSFTGKNGDISSWDVSNVKNMEEMFWGCKDFCIKLDKWNVTNVKNIKNMFTYVQDKYRPNWYK